MDVLTKSQILHGGIQNILNKQQILRGKQWDAMAAMGNLPPEQIAHSYFKLPTGFGKTVMFTLIADAYLQMLHSKNIDANKNKVIILVPRLSLIDQTLEKLNEFSNIDNVGVLSSLKKLKRVPGMKDVICFSGKDKSINRKVIISTYQSMEKLFHMVGDDVGLVIADEAHHAIGNRRLSVLNRVAEYAPIIGFTATPVYSADHSVADLLGTEIYSMDVKGGVNTGMICPVKNILYRTSMIFDPSNLGFTNTGDFDWKKIIDEGVQFDIMVREIAQICAYGKCDGIPIRNMKIMINCPSIDIAIAQARAINKILGYDIALPIHSRQKNFEQLKEDFKVGKFRIACQVNTLTEGFDDETVMLCINYPSASRVRIEQASGRVLRKDLNNDRKVAYVLDTLFHGGEQESMDDSIIKAHERGQVLFMDIGGGPVLFPKDFPQKIYGDGHRETYDPITFNFELITDSKTLMFLEKNYKNWIDETDNQNWLTPLQLAKHYGVTYIAMEKYLNEMKAKQEMQGCIKDRELLGGRTAPCLHNDEESRQKFQQELDKMKILNEGKGTWLTPFDITQYCGLTEPTIEVRLNEMKTDPRMKEHIQSFRTKYGRVTPHLRNNAESIELFQSILNEQNFLTEKWLSPVQLMQYCGLAAITIENRLNEMQHDPRIQKYIQGKKLLGGRTAQCLQNIPEAIEIFKKLLNEVWLTPTQLMNYCDLKSAPGIEKRLNEMKPDPRMKGLIQDRKIKGGRLVPCLRGDEKSIELFRQILNETWLSSSQLMKYCKMDHRTIENYLINMQEDPRMQGHTCYRTLQKGRVALCLRGDQESIDLFLTILKEQKINDLKHGTVVLTMAIISGGKQKSDAHKR